MQNKTQIKNSKKTTGNYVGAATVKYGCKIRSSRYFPNIPSSWYCIGLESSIHLYRD